MDEMLNTPAAAIAIVLVLVAAAFAGAGLTGVAIQRRSRLRTEQPQGHSCSSLRRSFARQNSGDCGLGEQIEAALEALDRVILETDLEIERFEKQLRSIRTGADHAAVTGHSPFQEPHSPDMANSRAPDAAIEAASEQGSLLRTAAREPDIIALSAPRDARSVKRAA